MFHSMCKSKKVINPLWFGLLCITLSLNACYERNSKRDDEPFTKRSSLTNEERNTIETNFKHIRHKKDEFSNFTWYKDKSSPNYVNQNGFYLFFGIRNDGYVTDLRLRIQYYAVDWLFIQSYDLNVDGKNYSLYALGNVERDNDNGFIWEWYDFTVNEERKPLIQAISTAKKVKIRFNGSQYYDTRALSKNQVKAINNVFTLYEKIQNILSKPSQYTDTLQYFIQ